MPLNKSFQNLEDNFMKTKNSFKNKLFYTILTFSLIIFSNNLIKAPIPIKYEAWQATMEWETFNHENRTFAVVKVVKKDQWKITDKLNKAFRIPNTLYLSAEALLQKGVDIAQLPPLPNDVTLAPKPAYRLDINSVEEFIDSSNLIKMMGRGAGPSTTPIPEDSGFDLTKAVKDRRNLLVATLANESNVNTEQVYERRQTLRDLLTKREKITDETVLNEFISSFTSQLNANAKTALQQQEERVLADVERSASEKAIKAIEDHIENHTDLTKTSKEKLAAKFAALTGTNTATEQARLAEIQSQLDAKNAELENHKKWYKRPLFLVPTAIGTTLVLIGAVTHCIKSRLLPNNQIKE